MEQKVRLPLIRPRGKFSGDEVIDQKRKHLEPEELKRLFEVLYEDPFWYGYFRLQYYFGCRVTEIALVLKEDIEWDRKLIVIRRLKKKQIATKVVVGEDGKRKRVPIEGAERKPGFEPFVYQLPDSMIDVLRDVPQREESPWFFSSMNNPDRKTKKGVDRLSFLRRTDGGWSSVSRSNALNHFKEAAKEAKIIARLQKTHVLRHTRATLLLASGATEEQVRFLLGHSSINTTRKYIGIANSLRARLQTDFIQGLGDLGGD